ncbi:unnamed protein product [Penicillium glandicola]
MFDQLVLGAIFTGLSSIGIWHSVPLTGITPSNSFFGRSLSSLEIVCSIHALRKVHPLVFPNDDAISEYDLLLQLSLDAQQYENARLALEHSTEAVSLHVSIPGVTTTMLIPSATAMPAAVYLNDGSAAELQSNPPQNNTLYFTLIAVFIFVTLTMQMMGFGMMSNIKGQVDDMQYDYFARMSGVQEQFSILIENEQVRPIFVHLAESITNSSADLQHCLLHIVGVMEDKYTSSMISIESKLDEVSQQHQHLMRNTESFPQIPRQLAWLNLLMAKDMSNDLPEGVHLDQPNFDLSKGPSPEQINGASKFNTAKINRLSKIEGALGIKKGNGVAPCNG